MNIIETIRNVTYLPLPNTVDIVLSGDLCDPALTKTAFVMLMLDDESFVMAYNQRRGMEIAGGHVDPGEILEQAARREAMEETGCECGPLVAIGYLRLHSEGRVPEGWAYPHPTGYQQFFAARVVKRHPYRNNDECGQPVEIDDLAAAPRPSMRIFGEAARLILK